MNNRQKRQDGWVMSLIEKMPLVSVGMPVKNCAKTLEMSIKSIIAQSYRNWELLMLDDGSEDDTIRIAKKYSDKRIKIMADGHKRGISYRLNQALKISDGKYFARMDGDDIAYPNRLERQITYLEKHPGIDLIGTWMVIFAKDGKAFGKRIFPESHEEIIKNVIAGFPIAHPTYVGRLSWFRRYKYREAAMLAQDQDLLLRSYRHSRYANLPEILLGYREEKINLKKIISGRISWIQILYCEFSRRGKYNPFLRGVLEQGIKGIIDCISVITRLNYHILGQRARVIKKEEKKEWESVWKSLATELMQIRR